MVKKREPLQSYHSSSTRFDSVFMKIGNLFTRYRVLYDEWIAVGVTWCTYVGNAGKVINR